MSKPLVQLVWISAIGDVAYRQFSRANPSGSLIAEHRIGQFDTSAARAVLAIREQLRQEYQ